MDLAALIAAAGSARAVLERLAEVRFACAAAVLALVVHTEGSTYRKRGALALIESDGRKTGVLSGGCLEAQLRDAALVALGSGRTGWLVFDSLDDDDLLFGSGSGCRGRTHVLLWPLDSQREATSIDLLLRVLREPVALNLIVNRQAAAPQVQLLVQVQESAAVAHGPTIRIGPLPRIWLIGAGSEAAVLSQLLRAQGWWLGLSEHRAAWRDTADLSAVDLVLAQRPQALEAHLASTDVLLIMSHNAQVDLDALRIAAASSVRAVGLLGPPARRDELLAQLDPAQREQLQGRLHAPVGLRLGGEGPMAIALSISAWLLGLDLA